MSKKKRPEAGADDSSRRSRKEVLIAQKEAEQTRGVRIGIAIVAVLILLILGVAVVNELLISPNRDVATVNGKTISLEEFQERVAFERAQRVIFLENQREAFNNDIGMVQQFASQWIMDLAPNGYIPSVPDSVDTFGEGVLSQMVDEMLIEQAAAARGIEVSEADIDEAIGAEFGYYGGGLPTPLPTATETVVPTPSLTPIPTAVITEVLPTATSLPDPTQGPTSTPFPTATPVSEEAYQEEFDTFFQDYAQYGVTDAQYRESFRIRLLRERLMEALAEEQELPTEAEHASMFVIATTDEAEAQALSDQIATDGYLQVWNEIKSSPFDPEGASLAVAAEFLQRTQDDLAQSFGEEVANAAFALEIEVPSDIVTAIGQDGTQQYFLLMLSGLEEMELAESTLQTKKNELLQAYLGDMRKSSSEINDFWRGRVPDDPALDLAFFSPPTPTPAAIQPEVTAAP
jgi:hypothetical protein